jgi:hypothetical protein
MIEEEKKDEIDGIPMGQVTVSDLFKVEPPKPMTDAVF